MMKPWLVAVLLCVVTACGGKSGSAAHDPPTTAGGAPTEEPACADTPRSSADAAANAAILDMARHAQPSQLIPLMISLVEVEPVGPVDMGARTAQLEPYQAPIAEHLAEWGAQGVERFWLANALAASLPAERVDDLLCLENVVRIDTDAPYWDIVEPPWSADEAGTLECPLMGDQCPEHCFDFNGAPWSDADGCYIGTERVACAKTRAAITDGAASCFENIATGKTYLFSSFVPSAPSFIGWRPCGEQVAVALCGFQ
jgi:hypothetical protein